MRADGTVGDVSVDYSCVSCVRLPRLKVEGELIPLGPSIRCVENSHALLLSQC